MTNEPAALLQVTKRMRPVACTALGACVIDDTRQPASAKDQWSPLSVAHRALGRICSVDTSTWPERPSRMFSQVTVGVQPDNNAADSTVAELPAVTAPPDRPEVSQPPALLWHHFRELDPKRSRTAEGGLPVMLPAYIPAAAHRDRAAVDFSWGGVVGTSNDAFATFDVLRHALVRPREAIALPYRISSVGGRVRTVLHYPSEAFATSAAAVQAACPEMPDLHTALLARRFVAIDATGLLDNFLPDDLEEVQFITVEPSVRDWFAAATGVPTGWPAWAPFGRLQPPHKSRATAAGFALLSSTVLNRSKILSALPILDSLAWPIVAGERPFQLELPYNSRARRRQQGAWRHNEGLVEVVGPDHGPIRFRTFDAVVPGLQDAQAGLARIQGHPAQGLAIAVTRAIEPCRAIFATGSARSSLQTVLLPSYGQSNSYLALTVSPQAHTFGKVPLPRAALDALFREVAAHPFDPPEPDDAGHSLLQVAINLDEHIPKPRAAVAWGVNSEICAYCVAGHAPRHLCGPVVPSAVNPTAAVAWNLLPPWPAGDMACDELFIFTDGSFFPKAEQATWALVVIIRSGPHVFRAGYWADSVHPMSKTVRCPSAYDGELEALLHALSLITAARCSVCHIGADCESAVSAVTGTCPTAPDDRLARAAVSLHALAVAQGQTIHFHKVPAHSGCGFNDLADQLAKLAGRKLAGPSMAGPWEDFWQGIDETVVDRLWLTAMHPNASISLPPLLEDGTWAEPNCCLRSEARIDHFYHMPPAATHPEPFTLSFRILQYNPLSLRPTGAAQLLAKGLRRHRIHIAGIQETRLKQTGMTQQEGFWVFHSACTTAGVGGTQIWIQQDEHWQRSAFSILHAEPQILLVLGSLQGQPIVILSAHAPPSTKPVEELEAWWCHLRTFLHDAAASIAQPKCANARLLRDLLDAKGLCHSPAFLRDGTPIFSWVSPQGYRKLIDYVLLPSDWSTHVEAKPAPDLGDLFADIDHRPVLVSLDVVIATEAPPLVPALTGEQQTLVGRKDVLDGFASHFAKAERAAPVSIQALFEEQPPVRREQTLEGDTFPTLADLASGFASLQKGRASGLSGLPCELYRLAPLELAFRYWPVICKTILRDCTPAQWSGGLAVAIPKPNKPGDQFASYRSIMLLEADDKGVQKAIRPQVVQVLRDVKVADQFGGLPGSTLQLPSALVRAHLHYLKRTKQCGALVFIDAASAYYAITRDGIALTAAQRADEDFLLKRARLLFTDPALQANFVACIKRGEVAEALAAKPATRILLQKHLARTWYVGRQDASCAYVASSGTAPGAPLADAMFSLVFAGLLRETRDFILSRGIQAQISGLDVDNPGFSPTWADDVCLLLQVLHADDLETAVADATAFFLDAMARNGLQANLGCGKTEALLACFGPGSANTRRLLLTASVPKIRFQGDFVQGHICLAEQYTHLGSVIRADGQVLPDITRRRELARELYRPIKRKLLCNPYLFFQEKTELLRGRVLPKFLYGPGLWSLKTVRERQAVEETIFSFYRGSFRPIFGFPSQGYTNEEIAGALCLPLPSDLLKVEQTRVLVRLHVAGMHGALGKLCHDLTWWGDATAAAREIGILPRDASTDSCPIPDLCTDLATLRSACKRFLKAGIQKRKIPPGLLRQRAPCDAVELLNANSGDLSWLCADCGAAFLTKRRLAVHCSKRHGLYGRHTLRQQWGQRAKGAVRSTGRSFACLNICVAARHASTLMWRRIGKSSHPKLLMLHMLGVRLPSLVDPGRGGPH
ncbi:unnamed protein product [Symbiodinium microadriaticum]|nr:unnamed protein product [Symbiodinium microadriaticum]CAE7257427.1 unnamed protein product [Symbiodinium sp. KB8]